jgi:hypothetical protein
MLSVGAFFGETMTVREALIERRRLEQLRKKYEQIAGQYQNDIDAVENKILDQVSDEGETHVIGNTIYSLSTKFDSYDELHKLDIKTTEADSW